MLRNFFTVCLLVLFLPLSGKVYDCFLFNHELDVLEIRLHELAPYVDHFVLVEWNRGHRRNNLTRFYFEENRERFAAFLPKIIHIKLDEVIETEDAWVRENFHRNQIMRGLTQCQPDDVIFVSDVDEIIPGPLVAAVVERLKTEDKVGFWQKLYRFFLNRADPELWSGTYAVRYDALQKTTPQELRNAFRFVLNLPRIEAGWHFTSMGGFSTMLEKYDSIVEGEDKKFATKEAWLEHVNQWTKEVSIDESFPKFVQENTSLLTEKGLIRKGELTL